MDYLEDEQHSNNGEDCGEGHLQNGAELFIRNLTEDLSDVTLGPSTVSASGGVNDEDIVGLVWKGEALENSTISGEKEVGVGFLGGAGSGGFVGCAVGNIGGGGFGVVVNVEVIAASTDSSGGFSEFVGNEEPAIIESTGINDREGGGIGGEGERESGSGVASRNTQGETGVGTIDFLVEENGEVALLRVGDCSRGEFGGTRVSGNDGFSTDFAVIGVKSNVNNLALSVLSPGNNDIFVVTSSNNVGITS